MPAQAGIQYSRDLGLLGPRLRGDDSLVVDAWCYAASALAPFSGAVIAPDALISAISFSE
jgi:hypothetical protein